MIALNARLRQVIVIESRSIPPVRRNGASDIFCRQHQLVVFFPKHAGTRQATFPDMV